MPKLSVIVPVYKVEKYIHQCLDSLLAQDYEDMEILLIDDGSPDRCGAICDDYAKKDARVRVIHQENQGIAEVRNVGVREARGDYIAFADSDDYLCPGMFSKMMGCFDNETVDMVVCDYYTFYDDAVDQLAREHRPIDNSWPIEKIRDEYLIDRYPAFMWNKIYRRSLFDGVSIPTGIVYEDLYVMAPLVAKARGIVYVPEPFYCYRQHASSFGVTAKIKKKWGMYLSWRERERVCEAYGFTRPLSHVRMRSEKAAISLKTIDLAAHFLPAEELAELDAYLAKIAKDTSRLSAKHKWELWALRHLPDSVCAIMGQLSIWVEERKQSKLK